MKTVQIIGLAIVGIVLMYNSQTALAIGLTLILGLSKVPPFMVGQLLFVSLFELVLIAGFRRLLRGVRAS